MQELLDKITIDWLAGFFDGEGCVHLNNTQGGGRGYHLTISIAQRDQIILAAIMIKFSKFGFKVEKGSPSSGVHYLRVHGRFSKDFLEAIQDKVIIKKQQVKLALEFIETIDLENFCKKTPDGILKQREVILQRLKENKKEDIKIN